MVSPTAIILAAFTAPEKDVCEGALRELNIKPIGV